MASRIKGWLDTAFIGARVTRSALLSLRALSVVPSLNKEAFFVVSIDTEQDVDSKYVHTGKYENIKTGIPRVLDIFDEFKVKPTWLITPDVAEHSGSFFSELAKKHEIGCHIHPEYFCGSIQGKKMEKILPQFSYQNTLEMVQRALHAVRQNVNVCPRSFRAGRFGVNMDTLRALSSCGVDVDCSLTPFLKWGFDSTISSPVAYPYFISTGVGRILEVPVTIVCPFGLFPGWLRPSASSGSDMINIMKIHSQSEEHPLVFNMMFHSMELINPNPYFPYVAFLRNARCVLEYAYQHDVSFVTMNDLYHRLRSSLSSER